MRLIVAGLVLLAFLASSRASAAATDSTTIPTALRTFWVSPTGLDTSPGTQAQPWHSFNHAMLTAQAGDEVVFGDGIYNETHYSNMAHAGSGTPGKPDFHPIVLRAEHPRRATLNFENKANQTAIWVIGTRNVVIKYFVLTQPISGTSYNDGLVRCWQGSDNCWLIDNEFRNAYEPVKAAGNSGTRIEGNLFSASNVAFGSFGTSNISISNNTIVNPGQDGIQSKGGTVNAIISNNTITTDSTHRMNVGIYLGGGSCGSACGVVNVTTGYEGTNVQATGNTITASGGAPGYGALVFEGCDECTASDNHLTNAGYAFRLIDNRGWPQPDGTTRIVPTHNASMVGNSVTTCTHPLTSEPSTTGTITFTGNVLNNCP